MVPEYAVRNHTSIALSDPFATKGVYSAPLLMVPPLPSGHAWARAIRARGRDDGPPRSHGGGVDITWRVGGREALSSLAAYASSEEAFRQCGHVCAQRILVDFFRRCSLRSLRSESALGIASRPARLTPHTRPIS